MCLLCLHSTFRVGIFSDSLAIDIKLKAKYELCPAAIVLCCITLCCVVLHCVVFYCMVLCCIALCCVLLYGVVLYCSCRQPQTYVKPDAAITVFELLMMNGVSLETC
jgi:hypothetical protein